ncbi:TRAP transporter large permease [Ancylobacter pratisalsi]|uniref:TRAP transporter large permease protein n=1 Tax=Ancylobacter pratisalsi TaxID=1745854 RepID=A0A6P1YP03_9HYPH|nr:TRAP transporter large permease [Ancylobacter pratisalsi]QIB34630.1 TRAP transporter large permease [Ancylobacter pratisalsi]
MILFSLIIVFFLILLMIGYPVGFAAGLASFIGAGLVFGGLFDIRASAMIARLALSSIDSFLLLAIPFFIFAGRLMNFGGITERMFAFVALLVRPIRGGLGHANVMASVIFAGMSGSATADAVGLGQIEMKAMLSQGYQREFSAGVTAASSLIGPILPPSIALVAYSVQAEVSVARMFFAAIVPALMMAAAYMGYVTWRARKDGMPVGTRATLAELWPAFRVAILPILTPFIIMGGIYSGVFTPTEAAAVAALYALCLGVFVYRAYGFSRLRRELMGTLIDTAVIMLIIIFTSAFGVVMIRAGIPGALAEFFASLTSNPTVLLFLMVILWMVVGCFMAQTPAILILTPILMPIIKTYGIDPIQFGILMTLTLTLGLLTPPVGMVLYALTRVTGLSFRELVRVSVPYVWLTLGVIVTLILLPGLITFLPDLLL